MLTVSVAVVVEVDVVALGGVGFRLLEGASDGIEDSWEDGWEDGASSPSVRQS